MGSIAQQAIQAVRQMNQQQQQKKRRIVPTKIN
jgi:hypothetical protein